MSGRSLDKSNNSREIEEEEEKAEDSEDEKDCVDKILERSRKLTRRHAKLSAKYREQRFDNFDRHAKDANLLSTEDWVQVLG